MPFFSLSSRGQGALEYLLLVGGAVLISTIILIIILSSAGTTGTLVNTNLTTYQDALDDAAGIFISPPGGPSGIGPPTRWDISYGADTNQVFDWYNPNSYDPPAPFSGPYPVIVFVHGGGFNSGNESINLSISPWTTFLARGYAIVSVRYRLADAADHTYYPDQPRDVGNAIKFIRENASAYNIDPNKIIGMGGSAGGSHLGYIAFSPAIPLDEKPNIFLNFRGPTDYTAFDDSVVSGAALFNQETLGDVSNDDKIAFSSVFHIIDGAPLIPTYSLFFDSDGASIPPIGEAGVHDVYFGERLWNALNDRGANPPCNVLDYGVPQNYDSMVNWADSWVNGNLPC